MIFASIPSGAPDFKVEAPSEGGVLLHACCAPCSTAVLEAMVRSGIHPTIFFSNSNISPKEEYDLRLQEMREYAALWECEVVEDEYDHEDWLERVARGRETAPERGLRCLECFRYRLERAAKYAAAHGCANLTTTLASSRWKSLEQVDAAGSQVCALVEGAPLWWNANWRKGGLQPRRSELIKALGMYNQPFCGCEFSQNMSNFTETENN